MNTSTEILTLICIIIFAGLFFVWSKQRSLLKKYEEKYSKIIDVDSEVEKSKEKLKQVESEIVALKEQYRQKRVVFEGLIKQAAIYDETIELAELGFYKPHFDFDTSEKYKEAIVEIRKKQKELVRSKEAVFCTEEWVVSGSKSKGKTMVNRGIRLTARAFNNECDAAVSNVRWNNMERMEKRIEKAFDAINSLNESNKIYISRGYLQLKLDELRLAYEHAEKKQREKEEQREIQQQIREEARLAKEVEAAVKEEEKYLKLLNKAQREAEKAAGDKLVSLEAKIAALAADLKAAQEKCERAKSMAEQTKTGHVYVISNIGSFGENVYKIGMTRRLEPLDRVKELGDASVPFLFDVHAMIHSTDAPALENALHKKFDERRLNLINQRKEFFNVSLEDIESEARKFHPDIEFIMTAEARDYRESQSILAEKSSSKGASQILEAYPEAI